MSGFSVVIHLKFTLLILFLWGKPLFWKVVPWMDGGFVHFWAQQLNLAMSKNKQARAPPLQNPNIVHLIHILIAQESIAIWVMAIYTDHFSKKGFHNVGYNWFCNTQPNHSSKIGCISSVNICYRPRLSVSLPGFQATNGKASQRPLITVSKSSDKEEHLGVWTTKMQTILLTLTARDKNKDNNKKVYVIYSKRLEKQKYISCW